MTTLAQLHDCHSCNDERSIDQKKRKIGDVLHPFVMAMRLFARDIPNQAAVTFVQPRLSVAFWIFFRGLWIVYPWDGSEDFFLEQQGECFNHAKVSKNCSSRAWILSTDAAQPVSKKKDYIFFLV